MRFTTSLLTGLAALATTASAANWGAANILAITYGAGQHTGGKKVEKMLEIPFGHLTHYDMEVSEVRLDNIAIQLPGGANEPRIDEVTCQMYGDEYGLDPYSVKFDVDHPAILTTNTVSFGWVLCYVEARER